ncbi:MAG: PD40 domain-containing protein [Candidatus Coatesbacteria bacterium]|nr:MAG: PD40 domain-containing protein [Candidatus Coatesbacteria bacterium]
MLNRMAVVLALMAIAASASAQPTGKIVFTSVRNGNAEVCVINANGTGFENLTDDDAYDDQPALSPDGTEVVFVSNRDGNRELYLMNIASGDVVRLTNTDDSEIDPVFTNDASGVIYTLETGEGRDVYRLDLVSGESKAVYAGGEDERMAYQGPGGKIAYVAAVNGDDEIMLKDSSGRKQLTDSPGIDIMPTITADGKQVFFVTTREGDYDLYLMYADGTGERPFLNTETSEGRGAPSPDGGYVAVANEETGSLDIYVYDMDGNRVLQLTDDAYDNYEPHWSK